MIKKIAHISDVHIRKSPSRNDEYYDVFNKLYESLKENDPCRIVICGDLVNDYIDLQGEQLILLSDFLTNLSTIAKVIIIRGNHDIQRKNLNRTDTIDAIVKTLNNPNIRYLNETTFFDDENVTWAVWKHADKKISPWKLKTKKYNKENIVIDLFHNTVNGCINSSGHKFNSNLYVSVKDLKGDYSFLGHIHKQQFIDKHNKKAYAGSLIAQGFDEGDDEFHGYILWDIENNTYNLVNIPNEYSFKSIEVNSFTDFNDLDLEIDNPTKYMRIRIIWRTLPYIKSNENIDKIKKYLNDKYSGILSISNKEEFIEDDKIDIIEDDLIKDINNMDVQHDIFKEYLEKIGVEDDLIKDVIKLDQIISDKLDEENFTNIEWDIVRFGGENFMSYEKFDIDWYNKNGLYQILGKNTNGKTNLIKVILYTAYNKTPETEKQEKFGDIRYINNRLDVDYCNGYIVIEVNSEFYGIKRETVVKRKKNNEISNVSTDLYYYKLKSPYDELSSENSIDNLTDKDKIKTRKLIERILGDYNNFMRVVYTTSDTLNNVLSNDMSNFIDSLLYDSGLDLFDKKLKEFKKYKKDKQNNKPRINCDVQSTENKINEFEILIEKEKEKLIQYNKELINIKESIKKGNDFIDQRINMLYNIDSDIYNLDVDNIKKIISICEENIKDLNYSIEKERKKLVGLAEKFDEERYNNLNDDINKFKNEINNKKIEKNNIQNQINIINHEIEIINGKIYELKKEGKEKKKIFEEFKNSPTCPECGQKIVGNEHKDTFERIFNKKREELYNIAEKIKKYENNDIVKYKKDIKNKEDKLKNIEEEIINMNLEMDKSLKEIGELTNQKNDVDKRKEIEHIIEKIPLQIQIEKSKINENTNLLIRYDENLEKIQKNKINENIIAKAKNRMNELNNLLLFKNNQISESNNYIKNINEKINDLKELIKNFNIQERDDKIDELYKKCVHRDGIPKQILSNYVVPKINIVLKDQLKDLPFNVWLDGIDFKPKLTYKDNPNSTINAIGSSGKERTFASLSLKQALISINKKSKPKLFLLDEVTGKLVDESVDEFIDLLNNIKKRVNKLVVIEHTHEIEPDYVIKTYKNEKGVSFLEIE